jgi:hypothetical protein
LVEPITLSNTTASLVLLAEAALLHWSFMSELRRERRDKALAESMERTGSERAWERLISLGIPPVFVGVGLALMVYSNFFWSGVIVVYFGLGFFLVAAIKLRGISTRKQLYFSIGSLFFILGFSWIVFRPSPLQITMYLAGSGYKSGEMGGINWEPEFGDLRITIENPTDRDYSDLNLSLNPGGHPYQVIKMVETTTAPKVEFYAEDPQAPIISLGTPSGNIPIIPSGDRPAPLYRIRCDKLPRHSKVEIVAAIARFNPPLPGPTLPPKLLAPFVSPKEITLVGQFNDFYKPIKATKTYPD